MEKKKFWRSLIVILLVLFSVLYILPTLLPGGTLPKWYPFEKRLGFGLDINGGLELRYAVDYKKAIMENTRDLMFRMQEFLVREEQGMEEGAKVERPQVEELRKRATFSVPTFDTLVVESEDQALLDRISTEALEERLDPRYAKVEEGDGRLVLRMYGKNVDEIKREVLDQTLSIIRKRIDAFGLVEPDVRLTGENNIDVQLPLDRDAKGGTDRLAMIRERIGQTARLTFRIVDDKSDFFATVGSDLEQFRKVYPGKGKGIELANFGGRTQLKSTQKSDLVGFIHYLQSTKKLPDDHLVGFYFVEDEEAGRVVSSYYRTEYMFADAKVTGEHLARARVFYKDTGEPYVGLTFTTRGAQLFEDVTREHVGEYLAILLDDDINSAPVIKEVIAGGSAQISLGGNKSAAEILREAQSLVTVLTHGAYKAPVHKIQDVEVGPSLGQDAINAGVLSLLVGAVLVVIFMFFYYRGAGLVANLALIFNLLFILAILIAFNSALTLPGLAGIVLTVGMAVDANVIIFERIREEIRAGKAPRPAIETGYQKSTWTIIDAQLTTALAAVILLNFTTGPIYGFAVTLLIGIICTVFTALFVTKLVFTWMLEKKLIRERVSI